MADEAVAIGPGPASESYLRGDKIIAAALETKAEAIHPGYGFLAENADFAEAVGKAGIKFIGPSPDAMRRMGGKAEAKAHRGRGRRAGGARLPRRRAGRQGARQRGQAHRLSRHDQGGGRRRRARHAAGRARGGLRRRAGERAARGAGRVRRCPRAAREGDRPSPPHRGAGVRRHPRQRRAPLRARLLAAAAQPEGDRGGARAGHVGRAAREDHGGRRRLRQGGRLRGRRHGRVPGRGRQRSGPTRPGTSSR